MRKRQKKEKPEITARKEDGKKCDTSVTDAPRQESEERDRGAKKCAEDYNFCVYKRLKISKRALDLVIVIASGLLFIAMLAAVLLSSR